MKLLALSCVLILVGWGAPLVIENASAPCGALAALAMRSTPSAGAGGDSIGAGLARLLGDAFVARAMEARYPGDPPELMCIGVYWQAIVFPASMDADLRGMPGERAASQP